MPISIIRVMRKVIFITILVFALVPTSVLSEKMKVTRQFPVYDNGGKPDLVVDPSRFVSSIQIVDRNLSRRKERYRDRSHSRLDRNAELIFLVVQINTRLQVPPAN